jgi:hypothetical protein
MYLPYKLTLNFFTDAYTAVAGNAFRHIDVNVGMGVVYEVWLARSSEIALAQIILKRLPVKRFLR